MRKALLTLLAMAAALPLAAPAQAAAAGKDVYDLGRCIARADRATAVRLMDTLPLTGEADVRGQVLGGAASCMAAAPATVSAIDMRGALAQDLFIKDFREFGVQPSRSQAEMARFELPVDDDDTEFPLETRAMYRLADCTVRNDTANIEKLVMSPVGSTQETKLINMMGPTIAACMPRGVPLTLSKLQLRGLLAQSAYQVATRYATGSLTHHDAFKN